MLRFMVSFFFLPRYKTRVGHSLCLHKCGSGGARCNYFESVNYSLINRFFGQIPGEIVLGLFEVTSLRSVNSAKPRTISPGIDLKIG
jgi:hypothetical protein